MYLAVFNTGDEVIKSSVDISYLGIKGKVNSTEIWSKKREENISWAEYEISPHSVMLYKLEVI